MSFLKRLTPFAFAVSAAVISGCGPTKVEPEMSITATPRTLDGVAQKSVLRVVGTDDVGKAATGKVRITSSAGSLKDGEEVDFLGGEATGEFSCARASDANCSGTVRLTAEWVTSGKLVSANTTVTISPPVVVVPDAGTTLTSSKTGLTLGLNQTSDLVATYTLDGVPTPGAPVSITTSLGEIVWPDGGAFTSPAFSDGNGQVHAALRDTGVAGMANVTAAGPMGRGSTASVTFTKPTSTLGITSDKMSITVGFNDNALITVNNTVGGAAVAGRRIQLDTTAGRLIELDGGAFTSPGITDSFGVIRAYLTDTGSPASAFVSAVDPVLGRDGGVTVKILVPDAGVIVTSAKSKIYVGINDTTSVLARYVANGSGAAGKQLDVSTTLGELVLPDGGVFSGTGTTDATGTVPLVLRENSITGLARITATEPVSTKSGSTNVTIGQIGSILYTSMTCAGAPCTIMGIRSSGYNTLASLRFAVKDNVNMGVAGVPVTFVLNNAPSGTTVTANGVTDSAGNVDAVVSSGESIGSFSVTATVFPGMSDTSSTIGVRGAKPTNKGIQMQCRVNLAAYRAVIPPLAITDPCSIILTDRNNNPVGTGTTVQFLAEAGSITTTATITPFVAPAGVNEGRGTVNFSSSGLFPAADVPPLTASPGQFPFPRPAEPQAIAGALTRNPRDGLVTLIAFTDGEEWFSDDNANGTRDGTEQFVDQGEPFVDSNDNDVRDPGENFVDVDNNGSWTAPDGMWNANSKVWTKTFVLYTDTVTCQWSPAGPFNVAKGGTASHDAFCLDLNLNVAEGGSSLTLTRMGTKGTYNWNPINLTLDGYGMVLDPRRLTNAAGTGDCQPSTPICSYRTVFGTWPDGYMGALTLNGAMVSDMTPAQPQTYTLRVTVRGGASNDAILSGTMQ